MKWNWISSPGGGKEEMVLSLNVPRRVVHSKSAAMRAAFFIRRENR